MSNQENPGTDTASIVVRQLTPADHDRVVALDAKITGRRRQEYFDRKLNEALTESGVLVSLAAELDGLFAGFLLARVYYGEFGLSEPTAVLDTLGVHPDMSGRGTGRALLEQLIINLGALGVSTLRTEVGWDEQQLLGFFHRQGFHPAQRLCLEMAIDPTRIG